MGFFLDKVWIREQKFSAGWIGESDENDMTPDIYENVKDQKKKLQTQAPAPFLKLKFKKKKGKTKTKRTKTTTGKPPQAMYGITSGGIYVKSPVGFNTSFLVVIGELQDNYSQQCVKTGFVILICL